MTSTTQGARGSELAEMANELLVVYGPEGEMSPQDWHDMMDDAFKLARGVLAMRAQPEVERPPIDDAESERAVEVAKAWLARAGMPESCQCNECTSARVLLALHAEPQSNTMSPGTCLDRDQARDSDLRAALSTGQQAGFARGWKAGLEKLADYLDAEATRQAGSPASGSFKAAFDAAGAVAHARALAETPKELKP